MVTIRELTAMVRAILKEAGTDNYMFEARCITEFATGLNHASLMARQDQPVSENTVSAAVSAAEKRSAGYPLQYIAGEWEFYGLPFRVGEGVLIPRQDTETLVECVLNQFKGCHSLRIADLCSGSGCIPIVLEKYLNEPHISAVEYYDAALGWLKKNTELNSSDISIYKMDVLNAESCRSFSELDLITSNPPYLTDKDMAALQKEVTFEPETALLGGSDGLLFYRTITALWKSCLKKGGMMFYEIGAGQEKDVSEILASNGFTEIKTYPDLCGIIRVVSGVYNNN